MSKVKVKKIKMPVGASDEGLAEMFNQMLGTGSVNMTLAYPRYKRIKDLCTQQIKLFKLLATSPFMERNKQFNHQREQILKFCEDAEKKCEGLFYLDFADYEWNLTLVDDELRKKFTEAYDKMKKDELVKTFIIMYDRLIPYRKNFEDSQKFNPKFINNMAGAEWCPFPFTNLNIKHIFSLTSAGSNTITFFMCVLNKAYEFSGKVYNEVQSPDVDVEQFVDIIMKSIDNIQKQPELHRCHEAFQKIKDSVKMLKNNFNGYYRDFIGTNDSTIMMQHFILDVSKSTDASPVVTAQFRKIITYYRKVAQQQTMNPKVKMLFDKVNESFSALERGTENLVNIKGDSDEDCDGPDSDPLISTSTAISINDLEKEEINDIIINKQADETK